MMTVSHHGPVLDIYVEN